jgi:hypothetical protein
VIAPVVAVLPADTRHVVLYSTVTFRVSEGVLLQMLFLFFFTNELWVFQNPPVV